MGAIQAAMSHWEHIAPVLVVPKTEDDYNKLVNDLDYVLDAGGADENNPLAGLAGLMAELLLMFKILNL